METPGQISVEIDSMTLQAVWGEPIDVEAALAALNFMLAGLARTKAAAGTTVKRTI